MKDILLLAVAVATLSFTSCIDGDDTVYETETARNCQIASFKLSHDSVPALAAAKFTIDQLNGRIFNIDSLPYGAVVDTALCTITFIQSQAVSSIEMRPEATGETIAWKAADSIDFSQPVTILITNTEGGSKTYKAQVNIHQVIPDSMPWVRLFAGAEPIKEQVVILHKETYLTYILTTANNLQLYQSPAADVVPRTLLGKVSGLPVNGSLRLKQMAAYEGALFVPSVSGALYHSADGLTWQPVNGASVLYILGIIQATDTQTSALAAISNQGGNKRFAALDAFGGWQAGEAVPDGFPLTGFGYAKDSAMYHAYLTIAGGRDANGQLTNSVWSTADGLNWAKMTDDKADYFSAREGAALTRYDGKLWLIGGLDAQGAQKDIYHSLDRGVTWTAVDSLVVLPDDYAARGFSSVHIDAANNLLLFGGTTSAAGDNEKDEIWSGRINRLGF